MQFVLIWVPQDVKNFELKVLGLKHIDGKVLTRWGHLPRLAEC